MKKILASILVLTMLVCCMSISAFAVDAPATITIDNASAKAGGTVVIPVNVVVHEDFAAVKVTLSTDLEGAKITKISTGEWCYDNMATAQGNIENGQYVWANTVNVDLEEKGSGTMVKYTLSIPADAVSGEYTLTINCIDYCYVDVNNNNKATSINGLTTSDTAVLTVEGTTPPQPPVHEHDFSGEWKSDAENHWKECPADGEKAEEAAHVYDNAQDAECNTCGYTREVEAPHEHEAGSTWEKDENGHWNVCSCGEKLNAAAHVYADDADKDCDICGYERHLHVAGTEFGSDKDNHWNTCECGEKVNVEAHVYADDEDTTCDTCGYERTIGEDKPDEGDKDEDKDEDKKDDTTNTGDNTNLYIYMALCLFAAAAIVVASYELKKNRG